MACWSRRTVLILLGSLLLLSVIVRYPLVEHERYQTDSYFIHHLADTVAVDGYAPWTYHPLSYVGYYPLSYPSGVPFLLAEFSVLSGLSVEVSILVVNMIIASLFCCAVFLLARQFIPRVEFAVLATFFAICGSRFVDTTYWDASARGPIVVMLILVVLVSLRAKSLGRGKSMVVVFFLALSCLTMHHMAVLLILIGIAYVLAVLETDYMFVALRPRGRILPTAIGVFTMVLIVVVPFLLFDYFWESAARAFKGSLFESLDSVFLMVILGAASSYANQIGFVLLFAVAYIPIMMRSTNLTSRAALPLFIIVAFIPIFGDTLYVSMVLSPFVAFMGSLWFASAFRKPGGKKRVAVLLVALMISSFALPLWSTDRWNSQIFVAGDGVVVENQEFNDAYYAMYSCDAPFAVCNVHSVQARMEALSRVGFLGSGISLVLNGDVSPDVVQDGIQTSSKEFPKNIYSWYEYEEEPPVRIFVRNLIVYGVSYLHESIEPGGASDYFSSHSRLVVVIDNSWFSEYLTTSSVIPAKLPGELTTGNTLPSFLYYQSSEVSMFLVQLPEPVI